MSYVIYMPLIVPRKKALLGSIYKIPEPFKFDNFKGLNKANS